jgi:hypothetical protein
MVFIMGYMFFTWLIKRPFKRKGIPFNEIPKYVEILYFRGYDGGFIIIEIPKTGQFLQFRKYIIEKGNVGIQFDYPLTPSTKSYYGLVKDLLINIGVHYQVEDIDRTYRGKQLVEEFIVIDFGQDFKKAASIAQEIIKSIYQIDTQKTVDISFGRVSARNIGFSE